MLSMVTSWLSAAPVSPSESVALALTVLVASPSGNEQTKLPEVSLKVAVPSWTPLVPQLTVTPVTVSSPGSVMLKV